MNLNSKRVAAALLTLAAFTGVLIKDLPFTASEGDRGDNQLLSDNSLGNVALHATGAEPTVSPALLPQVESTELPMPFNILPSGTSSVPGAGSLSDKSGADLQRELPNPVGASPKSSTTHSPIGASHASGGQGLASGTPGFSGNNGGDSGVGSPGSGGTGTPPGDETDKTGGFTPDSPIVNKPDANNASADQPPQNPDATSPSNPTTDDKGPASSNGTDLNSPSGNENIPDSGVTPPWIDDSLPVPPATFPSSDVPNSPGEGNPHSVPDSGSSVMLLATALTVLLTLRRKAKVA